MSLLGAAVVMYVFVALKSFQQLNVTLHRPWWVMPTSYGLAFVEVALIADIAAKGVQFLYVAALGTAAGLGCLSSMWLHRRMRHGR